MKEEEVLGLIDSLIEQQESKLLAFAQEKVGKMDRDDLLQSHDYPQLAYHPHFRGEEGILDGLHLARTALLSHFKESVACLKH